MSRTDVDYLRLAFQAANVASGDPATQNGAVIVTANGSVLHAANKVPHGLAALPSRLERPEKYKWVEHAERRAIYAAAKRGDRTDGATLYCCWFACPDCARAIICAGVKEVVGHVTPRSLTPPRWESEVSLGELMLREAGVSMRWLADKIGVTIMFDGRRLWV